MRGRSRLVAGGLLLVFGFGLLLPRPANAASLQDLLKKQADLQQQAQANQQKLNQKKQEAADLQQTIQDLDSTIGETEDKISNTEEQISLTNQVIEQLAGQVTDQQAKLDEFNSRLRSAYDSLYELSQTSPLEVLLQSDSLNDLVSHTQYVQAIQGQLQDNITQVNSLIDDLNSKKTQSQQQKDSLVTLDNQLSSAQASLQQQKHQKDALLNLTQGEQAKYQDLVQKLATEQENISQQIYDARRAMAGGEQISFGSGGYPWANDPDPNHADPWLFITRQCTSFAAWKFFMLYGIPFFNTRPGSGSAWNWPALAHDQGYQTSNSPSVNAVVSWPIGRNMPFGHVAIVTGVHGNGTIDVEEYNWVVPRGYSQRQDVDPLRYGSPTYIKP
jgi:surface antigen/uncharacterized coiled-coil protein SlyX